jgi:hypothetical protein
MELRYLKIPACLGEKVTAAEKGRKGDGGGFPSRRWDWSVLYRVHSASNGIRYPVISLRRSSKGRVASFRVKWKCETKMAPCGFATEPAHSETPTSKPGRFLMAPNCRSASSRNVSRGAFLLALIFSGKPWLHALRKGRSGCGGLWFVHGTFKCCYPGDFTGLITRNHCSRNGAWLGKLWAQAARGEAVSGCDSPPFEPGKSSCARMD